MQMSAMMRGTGFGGSGGMGTGPGAFPAPGVPSSVAGTAGTGTTSPTTPSSTTQPGAAGTGANLSAGAGLPNPALLQALLGAGPFGGSLGAGGFGGGFGGLGGGMGTFGVPPAAPADTRPPEERFQVQLQVRPIRSCILFPLISLRFPCQQLQDMGFTNAAQNVRALLATGGNVHAAIEYILSGGGL